MLWPGMNQVASIPWRRSSSRIRAVPTMPKSPREIMVGVVSSRAIAPEALSRSKVRQTKCWAMALSSSGGDMGDGAFRGVEDMDRAGAGACRQQRPRLDRAVARRAQGDDGAVRQMHMDIARLPQPLHRIDAAAHRHQPRIADRHMLGPDAERQL